MRKLLAPLSGVAILAAFIWVVMAVQPIRAPDQGPKAERPAPAKLSPAFQPPGAPVEEIRPFLPEPVLAEVQPPHLAREEVALPETRVADVPLPPGPKAEAPREREAFANLPLGKERVVDFTMDESTRGQLTPREQADQLRDWLLFAVVGDAGLTADEVNRVLFDVPAARFGYLRPLANFEYGKTRSCFIGDGRVIALVPRCGEAERKDYLAHVADEQRKSLGEAPERFLVFEYELESDKSLGRVTRREDVPGADLFTAAYGYREERVEDLDGLHRFLVAAPDVTFARLDDGALVLGGRKLHARASRGLRAEDVAAVWKAQDQIKRHLDDVTAEFKRQHDALQARWQAKLDALNSEYRLNPCSMTEEEYKSRAGKLQEGYDAEAGKLNDDQDERRSKMRLVDHTGFSLDPTYDYEGLAKWYAEEAMPQLEAFASGKEPPVSKKDLEAVRKALEDREDPYRQVPLLKLLDRFKTKGNGLLALTAEVMEGEARGFQFQAARYDGELQGTEVGMVLFYTDLLAKLWAGIDLGDTAPRKAVDDFRTMPDGGNAPIYYQLTREQPNTRLWFGPEDRGFQLLPGKKGLLFARRSTRIFAASSNPLEPGKEVPANPVSERVLGWWNDHYEEVAAYEPEYERLNEYMKWSLIVSWLYAEKQGERLGFLAGAPVDHSAWFPDWVRKYPGQPGLRFRGWEQIAFRPRGYKGVATEALPLLSSKPFKDYGDPDAVWTISGGVSGGSIKTFIDRPALPESVDPALRLSLHGADLKAVGGDPNTVQTARGVVHHFDQIDPGRARMRVEPKPDLPLYSPNAELRPMPVERSLAHTPERLTVETRAGGAELGALRIEPTRNGFKVGNRSRDIARGQALACDVSRSGQELGRALAADARVETVVRIQDQGGPAFLVKVRGAEQWLKLAPETAPSAALGKGWDSRAASTAPGAKGLDLAWVGAEVAPAHFGGEEYVGIELAPLLDKRPGIPVVARGPPEGKLPEGAGPVEVADGPATFRGVLDPKRQTVFVRVADLPPDLARSPEQLTRLFRSTDLPALREALASGKVPRLGSAEPIPTGKEPVIAHLEAGRKAEAAGLLAEMPEAKRLELLSADLSQRLADIGPYLDQARHAEALELLDTALRVHPEDARLLLLRGLAEVGRGRAEDAVAIRIAAREKGDVPKMLDELNRRLQGTAATPEQRAYLRAQARALAAGGSSEPGEAAAEVVVTLADGNFVAEAHLPGEPGLAKVGPGDLRAGDTLYLDDTLGLHNLDWSPAGQPGTLQQLVGGGTAELYRVEEKTPRQATTGGGPGNPARTTALGGNEGHGRAWRSGPDRVRFRGGYYSSASSFRPQPAPGSPAARGQDAALLRRLRALGEEEDVMVPAAPRATLAAQAVAVRAPLNWPTAAAQVVALRRLGQELRPAPTRVYVLKRKTPP